MDRHRETEHKMKAQFFSFYDEDDLGLSCALI